MDPLAKFHKAQSEYNNLQFEMAVIVGKLSSLSHQMHHEMNKFVSKLCDDCRSKGGADMCAVCYQKVFPEETPELRKLWGRYPNMFCEACRDRGCGEICSYCRDQIGKDNLCSQCNENALYVHANGVFSNRCKSCSQLKGNLQTIPIQKGNVSKNAKRRARKRAARAAAQHQESPSSSQETRSTDETI